MTDNPTKIADFFSSKNMKNGYNFDFSLKSLQTEIDKFLEIEIINNELQCELEAYIGEALCRIYNGKWIGEYYGPYNPKNPGNFYSSRINIQNEEIYPSHFLGYYLSNGKESEGTFSKYLSKLKLE